MLTPSPGGMAQEFTSRCRYTTVVPFSCFHPESLKGKSEKAGFRKTPLTCVGTLPHKATGCQASPAHFAYGARQYETPTGVLLVMTGKSSFTSLMFSSLASGLLVIFLMSAGLARADGITLAWDPNPEPQVAGYKVYSGSASRTYSGAADVGNWTSCFMSGLEPGKTYYFAATAYSSSGEESDYSSELIYSVPVSCSFSLSPASQVYSSCGGSGALTVVTGPACSWTVAGGSAWLHVTAGSSGIGPGSVSFDVAANTGIASRTASLTIGGQLFTVTQSGYSSSFTISASGGQGGFISPAGTSAISAGGSRTFTITPSSGYTVSSVRVDGANCGAVTTYTFTNVTTNHTIRASFKKQSSRWTTLFSSR